MREIPKKLLEKYGIRAQRDKLQEEHGELIEAIKKNDRSIFCFKASFHVTFKRVASFTFHIETLFLPLSLLASLGGRIAEIHYQYSQSQLIFYYLSRGCKLCLELLLLCQIRKALYFPRTSHYQIKSHLFLCYPCLIPIIRTKFKFTPP